MTSISTWRSDRARSEGTMEQKNVKPEDIHAGMKLRILVDDLWSAAKGDIIELRDLQMPIHNNSNAKYFSYGPEGKRWYPACHAVRAVAIAERINQGKAEIVRSLDSQMSAGEASASSPDDEHARMMKFFFGCKPSDPASLPPPPRVIGRSWDQLVDD
jgi:hypothetical protein